MKRSFSSANAALLTASTGLIAATYGLVRLAYGLLLPDVQADLGVGTAAAGGISAGASVVYCVGALTGLVLADRHARILVVAAGATAGGGALGIAGAPDAIAFGIAAVVSSAGAGLASPALVAVIGRAVRGDRVGSAQSAVNAGTGIGLVVVGALALLLLPHWRTVWAIGGIAALATAGAVLVFDPTRRGPARPGPARAALPGRGWFADHARVIVLALGMGAASAAVWNSGRALLTAAGADRGTSITAWAAIGVGGVAVIATARPMARLSPAGAWASTSGALAIGTVLLVLASRSTPAVMLACALFGWGYTAATGALIAWTTRIDRDRAASGTAMLFVVLVLGQAVGAAVAGLGIDAFGERRVFVAAGVLAAIAALGAVLPGHRRRPVPA